MIAQYDKTIIIEEDQEKKIAVIYNTKTKNPILFRLIPLGMQDVLDLINKGKVQLNEEDQNKSEDDGVL